MNTDKIPKSSDAACSGEKKHADLSFQDEMYSICTEISSLVKDIKKKMPDDR